MEPVEPETMAIYDTPETGANSSDSDTKFGKR